MNQGIRMPLDHASRFDTPSIDKLPPPGKKAESIPRGFRTKLILSVNGVFLVTMVLFLSVAFVVEKRDHRTETYAHLDETVEMIAFTVRNAGSWTPRSISELESKLSLSDSVPHRILFTDGDSKITGASDANLIGHDLGAMSGLRSTASGRPTHTQSLFAGMEWLVSDASTDSGSPGSPRVFVMRERSGSEKFARGFFIVHGLHVAVTMLAFATLLHLVGTRYLIRPIRLLAEHIESIENGDFRSAVITEREDEFGWLANRFTVMGRELSAMIRRQVRSEKYASVAVLSFRFVRELSDPLHSLERHIVYLEGLGTANPEINRIAHDLRRDKLSITEMMHRLHEIQPPPTDF